MKIRSQLAMLLLAAALPIVAFAVVLTALFWREQRAAFEQRFVERVRALAVALDREQEGTIRALHALAQSAHLASGDLRAFYAQAQRVQRDQPGWSSIIVADAAARQLLNLRVPFGAPLPEKIAFGESAVARVLQTGRPEVSALIRGNAISGFTTNVAVAVYEGAAPKYVLIAAIDPPAWLNFLRSYPVAPDATMTLVDQDGIVIARTLNHERWVGTRPALALYERSRESPEAAYRSIGLEGQKFYSAHSRASISSWTVATGVPTAGVESTLRRSTLAMAGGALLSLGLAVALALFVGRRIAQPIRTLAASADAVTRGERGAPLTTRIDEITQLARAMEEAGRAIAREKQTLMASDRAKDEFLAMLSHELRNPLAALTSASQVLQLVGADDRAASSARAVIERQTKQMTRIVEDLLDISRLTVGKASLSREVFDLGETVRSFVASWQSAGRFDDRNLEISVVPVWIDADRARIEQVLANLLDNALKFTPQHKTIRVSVNAQHGLAELRASDEGEGIAPEALERVFELFAQGEQKLNRAKGGLGIGLAIVKRLAELHGGSVSAESEGPGRGATFTVRIPEVPAPSRQVAPATARGLRRAGARRILIIEDNRDFREMLSAGLALIGHEVRDAADGEAGLRVAMETHPEIALIDIGLPGIDGYEVARRLRSGNAAGAMRLIALTGYGQPTDIERARDAGFDAHITKPVDLDDLELVLET
jgi:signal transduction histidine kinase/CheY-like chemotaxis protein